VLDDVSRSGSTEAVSGWAEDIEAAFGDLDTFLRHVQRRWYTALGARVDGVLERGAVDRQAEVRAAWSELAAADPGSRMVLDAYAGHPALQHGERRHAGLLAAALMSPPEEEPTESRVTVLGRAWKWCPLRSLFRLLVTR